MSVRLALPLRHGGQVSGVGRTGPCVARRPPRVRQAGVHTGAGSRTLSMKRRTPLVRIAIVKCQQLMSVRSTACRPIFNRSDKYE